MNTVPNESWRRIAGSDPDLEVSDQGRIRYAQNKRIRERATRSSSGGYFQIMLKDKDKKVWVHHKVHKLVLEAFVGPRPAGLVTRHLNGNKSDNRLENLVWGSYKENARDMIAHGRAVCGARQHATKFTYEDVENIRESKLTQTALARIYGVHHSTIGRIRSGKTWPDRRFRVHSAPAPTWRPRRNSFRSGSIKDVKGRENDESKAYRLAKSRRAQGTDLRRSHSLGRARRAQAAPRGLRQEL